MRSFFNRLFLISILCFTGWIGMDAQTVRILPLGNSITYDHNSYDESNPRPTGDRISYRYRLYQLLNADKHDFDFVGSEDGGNAYFQDDDYDDNAGFPGIQSDQLATLIATGFNDATGFSVAPGPYLNYYPADIILLHIGTNNLTTSAGDVEDVLDNIRMYDSDVLILVARIIQRATYHSPTTDFNNNVASMVSARGDSRIRMVNMENGAGINYAADMIDNLHPAQTGYDKMAQKWYDALMALNQAPSISSIPAQTTDMGTSFDPLSLDPYVSDLEDPDFVLSWSYSLQPGSKLTVSIDASRILRVTPDPDFSGTETVKLKVKDSGSGAFPAVDSIEVTFEVDHVNSPPVITSSPQTVIDQSTLYNYVIVANDADNDPLAYRASILPSWLTLNQGSHNLTGTAEHRDVGLHHVELWVSDGVDSVKQVFQIEVLDVNDPPRVTSPTDVTTIEDQYFNYTIVVEDADGDPVSYELLQKPNWLNYNATGHTLYGVPGNEEVGVYNLTLLLSDGIEEVYEPLKITVINENDPPVFVTEPDTENGVGVSYFYRCQATDEDPDDVLVYSTLELPEWLSFTTSSSESLVFGVPGAGDTGGNLVIIQVSDGKSETLQAFYIMVSWPAGVGNENSPDGTSVYPNPASDKIHLRLKPAEKTVLKVYSNSGVALLEKYFQFGEFFEVDISSLPEGIYYYQVEQEGLKSSGTFIKNR